MAEPVRVVVISDLNGSYGSTQYNDRVARAVEATIRLKPDIVLSTGDMVAGQRRPVLSEAEVRAMWRAFHEAVTLPLARAGIPLAVTPGNHDASAYPDFEAERRIYEEEWRQYRPAIDFVDPSTYPFFYAFEVDGIRFVSLDATTVGKLSQDQMFRLRAVFSDAGETRVIFSHLPLWPFSVGRESEVIGDPALQSLLVELGIDLHLSGHHHSFYPGNVGNLAVLAQGCLGGGTRRLIGTDKASPFTITVLEIEPGGEIRIEGRTGPDFAEVVDVETLPERIESQGIVINRLDLAPIDGVTLR